MPLNPSGSSAADVRPDRFYWFAQLILGGVCLFFLVWVALCRPLTDWEDWGAALVLIGLIVSFWTGENRKVAPARWIGAGTAMLVLDWAGHFRGHSLTMMGREDQMFLLIACAFAFAAAIARTQYARQRTGRLRA